METEKKKKSAVRNYYMHRKEIYVTLNTCEGSIFLEAIKQLHYKLILKIDRMHNLSLVKQQFCLAHECV